MHKMCVATKWLSVQRKNHLLIFTDCPTRYLHTKLFIGLAITSKEKNAQECDATKASYLFFTQSHKTTSNLLQTPVCF